MIKNWRVWFKKANDTKDAQCKSDTFLAATRQEAKQAFRACYRHDEYIITTVEEIN